MWKSQGLWDGGLYLPRYLQFFLRGGEGREQFLSDLCSSVLVTPFSRKGFGQQTSKERLQHWQ